MMVGVGRIYRDKDKAGRLYIPKKLMESLSFDNGDQVLIKVHGSNRLEVLKLEEVL